MALELQNWGLPWSTTFLRWQRLAKSSANFKDKRLIFLFRLICGASDRFQDCQSFVLSCRSPTTDAWVLFSADDTAKSYKNCEQQITNTLKGVEPKDTLGSSQHLEKHIRIHEALFSLGGQKCFWMLLDAERCNVLQPIRRWESLAHRGPSLKGYDASRWSRTSIHPAFVRMGSSTLRSHARRMHPTGALEAAGAPNTSHRSHGLDRACTSRDCQPWSL